MTHPILSMLPDEVRALHFEKEIAQFEEHLAVEKKKSNVVRDLSLLNDLAALDRELLTVKRRK